jgi:uncharacterized protein (TIGR00730 family)
MKKKYATTFGGSEFQPNSRQYHEAEKLGQILAEHGYVVKCGGYFGLMEAVCKGVASAGGTSIGITNSVFDPKPANAFISEERKKNDLFDRLRELINGSELFVFQEGGLGTLDELFALWCLRYTLTIGNVRICLVGSFWNKLLEGVKSLAVNPKEFKLLEVFETLNEFEDDLS